MDSQAQLSAPSTRRALLERAQRRSAQRGAASISTIIKVAFGWGMFLIMALFYAMLPIASLQLLPFLFFGCVCLLSSIYDDTGLSGDCK